MQIQGDVDDVDLIVCEARSEAIGTMGHRGFARYESRAHTSVPAFASRGNRLGYAVACVDGVTDVA